MTAENQGIDASIQTDCDWQGAQLLKYRRMKHRLLEFIAMHKSVEKSVYRANRRVHLLQREKRRLMRANRYAYDSRDSDMMDEDDEVDELEDEEEDTSSGSPPPRPVRRVVTSRRKPLEVPRDEDGNVILPFQIASLKVIELGNIVRDRVGFHSERYIWPIGYTVERTYMSMVDPDVQTTYVCKVEDGGEGPLFTIQAADTPEEEPISARTPTGAWAVVIKRANEVRKRESANAISGPEYYGFSNALVAEMIEGLPGVDDCKNYLKRSDRV